MVSTYWKGPVVNALDIGTCSEITVTIFNDCHSKCSIGLLWVSYQLSSLLNACLKGTQFFAAVTFNLLAYLMYTVNVQNSACPNYGAPGGVCGCVRVSGNMSTPCQLNN